VAAFNDRPEVQAFQTYLATPVHANARAKLGNWVSANKGVDIANFQSPIDKLSVEILRDPKTVFRFDGSDLMPAAVGTGTFWKGMVDWINGKETQPTLDYIENSWPK
jgi:alpha-glucoside transport system substrate-binding protein